MFEFNELPNEIKQLIFQKNRSWTSRQIQRNKEKYDSVLEELKGFVEDTADSYIDEEEEIIDNDWGFGNALIECINDFNIESFYEDQLERNRELYYESE